MRTDLTDNEMRYVEHVRIYMMGMERILDTSIPMDERTRLRERKQTQYERLLAEFRRLFPGASIRLADYYQSPDIRPPSPPFDLPDVSNDVFDELEAPPSLPTLRRTDSESDYGGPAWHDRPRYHQNARPGWMPSLPTIEYIEEEPDVFQEPMASAAAAGSRPVFQEPMALAAASGSAASVPGESLWQTYYRLFPQSTFVRPQKRPTSQKKSSQKTLTKQNKRHPGKKGTKSRKLRKRKSHTK